MRFQKGDKAFFMWIGEPTEVKITSRWGEDKCKFQFVGQNRNSGWTLKDCVLFSTIEDLMKSNILGIDKKIELLKKERERWCSFGRKSE